VPLCEGGVEVVFFLDRAAPTLSRTSNTTLGAASGAFVGALDRRVTEFVTTGFEEIRDLIALPANRLVVVDDGADAGVAW
jgi:hypothetical protein